MNPFRFLPLAALCLSGFSALMLEVAWTRMAVLILGTTTLAATIVLSSFMAGLAVGNLIIGGWLARLRNPLRSYCLIEAITAGIVILMAYLWKSWGASIPVSTVTVLVAIGIPATLMGMTLPLAVAGLTWMGWDEKQGSAFGYAINTIGGAFGALLGAFFLLPQWGLLGVQWIGGGILIAAAALAAVASTKLPNEAVTTRTDINAETASIVIFTCVLAFWGGASSLSLEVVWTRLFSLVLGPSVYALGVVLFVYLLAIAIGAFVSPRLLRVLSERRAILLCLLLLGFAVAWSILSIGLLPYLYVWLTASVQPDPRSLRFFEFLLSSIAMFPAAALHGILLPLLIAIYPIRKVRGRAVAWVLSWNTAGAISGVAITGLVTIPLIGFMATALSVLVIHLLVATCLLVRWEDTVPLRLRLGLGGALVLFLGLFLMNARHYWDRSVLVSGVYKYAVGEAMGHGSGRIEVGKVLYYREGISSTVAVIQTANDMVLSIDGKADATAYGDRSTQVLLGALPASLVQRPRNILVVGFASGVTAGVSSLFDQAKVVAVDIEPAVYEASTWFSEVNHGPLGSPHQLLTGDARRYLRTTSEEFDVITSEPSNPWMSGVAPLFTREFFELAKSRLASGGVMCQWLPIYGMSRELVASILTTFSDVFREVIVFESVEGYDLLLIGSLGKITLDPTQMESGWQHPALRAELAKIDIHSGIDLVGRFLMGGEGVRQFAGGAVLNTDDNGHLEFGAPLTLHLRTAQMNNRLLSEVSEGVLPYLTNNARQSDILRTLRDRFEQRGEKRLAEMLPR